MSDVTDLIVGIDFGSSGMTGGLARREASGKTTLLALSQIPGYVGIRRGAVHNVEITGNNIQALLKQLLEQAKLDASCVKVYVGMNGYTIHSIETKSSMPMSGNERLSEKHLDELNDEAQLMISDELCTIDVFPQDFLVDGKSDTNPVGTMPTFVEARFKFIVGQSFLLRNLDACFESLNLDYQMVLGSLASAEAVLTQEEKNKGVVVADFGAETTSIIVFKNNIVRYAVVLPFGGNNINKDLQHLNMDQQEAERIKLEKGSAIHYNERDEEEDRPESYNTFDKEANEVIVARVEEIIDNLYAQIRYAGIEPQRLSEGIVITGGASQLEGLSTVIANKTGMSVRIGNPSQAISVPEGMVVGPEDAQCIGLLLLGDKPCLEASVSSVSLKETAIKEPVLDGFEAVKEKEANKNRKEPVVKPVKQKNNRFGSLIDKMKGIKGLFDEEDI